MPATTTAVLPSDPSIRVFSAILPLMVTVFSGFLVIGMAMPVLPLHVHDGLGLGPFVVGLVAGAQFIASLLSRVVAGRFADRRGAKRAVVIGLCGAAAAGLVYLLSLELTATPTASAAVLMAGRALLGAAESFIITGALGWGLTVVDASATGKVIAWIGSAMYTAFAIGAPIGTLLYNAFGFGAIAAATVVVPLGTLGIVVRMRAVPPSSRPQPAAWSVLRAVGLPGLALALASVGFGAITTFVMLLFTSHGWGLGWQAFTTFALAFIAARTLLGHWPDRWGGVQVAIGSALLEAAGLALIWAAASPAVALCGTLLTGLGYSLVYPGLGVEAVRRAPPGARALAMGTFTACLDLALGVAIPLLGLVASGWGFQPVFLWSAIAVLGSTVVAAPMLRRARPSA